MGRGSRARDGRAVIDHDVDTSPLSYGGLESGHDHGAAVEPDGSEAERWQKAPGNVTHDGRFRDESGGGHHLFDAIRTADVAPQRHREPLSSARRALPDDDACHGLSSTAAFALEPKR